MSFIGSVSSHNPFIKENSCYPSWYYLHKHRTYFFRMYFICMCIYVYIVCMHTYTATYTNICINIYLTGPPDHDCHDTGTLWDMALPWPESGGCLCFEGVRQGGHLEHWVLWSCESKAVIFSRHKMHLLYNCITQVGLQKPCGLSSSEWSKTLQKGSSPMDRQRDISEHSQRNACPVHSSVPPDGEKPLSTDQEKVTSNSEQESRPVFDHPISSILSTDKPNSKCYPKL